MDSDTIQNISVSDIAELYSKTCTDTNDSDMEDLSANQNIIQYDEQDTQGIYYNKPTKRNREEEDDNEWTVVSGKKEKRPRQNSIQDMDDSNIIDNSTVYITSKEKLPKQFALARIFKANDINNVCRVKYLNPFKIRVQFNNELNVEKLFFCKDIIDMDWRIQKALEISYSYGVIRNIDLDLSEEEMFNNITCPEPAKLNSLKRLTRRSSDGNGWSPSECIRLCFKGSALPPNVFIYDMRVKVEPYVFPVSQCSQCWKLGHSIKMCPTKKIICPKCGGNHANCETISFKCINCSGNHMALSKTCPSFLKEKKIREIMSEFNCTYAKAKTMYVLPEKPILNSTEQTDENSAAPITSLNTAYIGSTDMGNTYANVVKINADVHKEKASPSQMKRHKKKKKTHLTTPYPSEEDISNSDIEKQSDQPTNKQNKPKSQSSAKTSFNELLVRLKEICLYLNLS
ncbi:uncharacterized protein LOC131854087 [Achroia grisella]|uniref:uncharacterized protein LOC131854087 n=1 Tax=Achroia grisella TaxID=688607 RepID=UPI0027D33BDD|nr:uncharacterized protein LOC131854087 [Achroia grisella]